MIHRRQKAQRLRIERSGPFQPGQHDEGDRGGVDSVAHRPIRIVERVQVVERARADGAHLERRSVGGRRPGDVPGQLEGAAVRNLEEVAGRGAVLGQQRSGRARRAGRRDPRVGKVAVQRRRVDEPEQNGDAVDAAALQRAHGDLHGARGRRQRHAEERTVDEPRRRIDPARLRHLQDGIVNVADSRQIVGDRNGRTGHYRGNDRRVQRAGGGVRRSERQREARLGELHTTLARDVGEVHRPRRGGGQRQPGCAEDLLGQQARPGSRRKRRTADRKGEPGVGRQTLPIRGDGDPGLRVAIGVGPVSSGDRPLQVDVGGVGRGQERGIEQTEIAPLRDGHAGD